MLEQIIENDFHFVIVGGQNKSISNINNTNDSKFVAYKQFMAGMMKCQPMDKPVLPDKASQVPINTLYQKNITQPDFVASELIAKQMLYVFKSSWVPAKYVCN